MTRFRPAWRRSPSRPAGPLACAVVLAALAASSAAAQPAGELPEDLEGIGVTQKLDARLPLEQHFTDERGNPVLLGELFEGDRPVVLTLVYYRCPMLCNLVLEGLVAGLEQLDWSPGQQYDVVTVSIDPSETPTLASRKKQSYLERLGRPGAARGWRFLTGQREAIRALAGAVGFRYQYLSERREYAHPAAIFVITPDGHVSRYLFGTRFDPQTLRLSLVEAGRGEIGSVVDQFLLYCYRYDSEAGRYTPVAWRLMRLGGVATALLLGGTLLVLWVRESRTKTTKTTRTA